MGAKLKVLVASGFLAETDERQLASLEVSDFLAKLYRLNQLAHRVRAVLDASVV